MEEQRKLVGSRIRNRRKALHLTQDYVAEYLNVSNNTVSSMENGKQGITLETLFKLCDLLGVTPNHLLLGSMHPNDIPQDIIDILRLCNDKQVRLIRDIAEMIYTKGHNDF